MDPHSVCQNFLDLRMYNLNGAIHINTNNILVRTLHARQFSGAMYSSQFLSMLLIFEIICVSDKEVSSKLHAHAISTKIARAELSIFIYLFTIYVTIWQIYS